MVSGFALILIMIGVFIANNSISQTPSQETIAVLEKTQTARKIEATEPVDMQNAREEDSAIRAGATLDLHGQSLEEVPLYVFQRLGIEKLDLSNNMLEGALQAEVRFLSNLIVLDLSNNGFTGVPAEVGQLHKLEVLNLSHNNLTGLPYELGNLQNLKILDLRGNEYSKDDLARIQAELPATTQVLVD